MLPSSRHGALRSRRSKRQTLADAESEPFARGDTGAKSDSSFDTSAVSYSPRNGVTHTDHCPQPNRYRRASQDLPAARNLRVAAGQRPFSRKAAER